MSMAHGDYEEIMNFANFLEEYITTVDEETGKLNSAFQQLGESWQDQKREAFEKVFEELMAALSNFKEQSSEQVPYLRELSERLKAYMQT